MKKTLLPLLFSSILFADCTLEEEQRAIGLWELTKHQKDNQEKFDELIKANDICPLARIAVDANIIKFSSLSEQERQDKREEIKELEMENTNLNLNDNNHIINNQKKIDRLLHKMVKEEGLKAVEEIGGVYHADIRFKKNSHTIEPDATINEIFEKIKSEVKKDSNALFAFEGGASSEGTATYNKNLSRKRANAVKDYIVSRNNSLRKHIKIDALGERSLVCEGDFLPEINPRTGEAECITEEDKLASRRVTIRRER